MVVTLRYPFTMKKNVEDAMKLFSNEDQDWKSLEPKTFQEVKAELEVIYDEYELAVNDLENDPNDITKKIKVVKAYQQFVKTAKAIKSYDDFNEDDNFEFLSKKITMVHGDNGTIENLIADIKADNDEKPIDDLLNEIEFSASLSAIKETVGSFYINNLLKDLVKPENRQKLQDEIKDKPSDIQKIYQRVLDEYGVTSLDALKLKNDIIREEIEGAIKKEAIKYGISYAALEVTFNEYNPARGNVPHLADIVDSMESSNKEEYEENTGRKWRSRRKDMEGIVKDIIEEKLLPLKGEL